jgi:hypothetical protein
VAHFNLNFTTTNRITHLTSVLPVNYILRNLICVTLQLISDYCLPFLSITTTDNLSDNAPQLTRDNYDTSPNLIMIYYYWLSFRMTSITRTVVNCVYVILIRVCNSPSVVDRSHLSYVLCPCFHSVLRAHRCRSIQRWAYKSWFLRRRRS